MCEGHLLFFPFSIYVYWNKTIQSYDHACSDSCICCLITCLIDSSVSYRFLDFFMSRTCLDFQICKSCMKEASSGLECTLYRSLTNRLHPGRMGGTLIFLGLFFENSMSCRQSVPCRRNGCRTNCSFSSWPGHHTVTVLHTLVFAEVFGQYMTEMI